MSVQVSLSACKRHIHNNQHVNADNENRSGFFFYAKREEVLRFKGWVCKIFFDPSLAGMR